MKSSSFTAKKALSLLLALIMLISFSGCHGNYAPAGSTESTTEAAPVTFTITDQYILTRPEDAESDETEAMKLLRTGIKSACGIDLEPRRYRRPRSWRVLTGFTALTPPA